MPKRAFPAFVLSCSASFLLAITASGADSRLLELKIKLGAATDSLLKQIKQRIPQQKVLRIAVVPLVDMKDRTHRERRLGITAAEMIDGHLIRSAGRRFRVRPRMMLRHVTEEQQLWIADLIKRKQSSGKPVDLVGKADLVVVGTTQVADAEILLELRVITVIEPKEIAAAHVILKRSSIPRDLLYFLVPKAHGPGEGPDIADVARVTHIKIQVKAQRASPFGGLLKEWIVKPGETLRAGDRFNIRFTPDSSGCVYIFMHGSDGKTQLLFPSKDWEKQMSLVHGLNLATKDPYCYAEWDYLAPGRAALANGTLVDLFYRLDNTPGRNIIYVAANRSDVRGIDDIRIRMNAARDDAERMAILRKRFDYVQKFEFKQR